MVKSEYYFVTCKKLLSIEVSLPVYKYSFILTWSCPFSYRSPVAAFILQRQSWVVAAATKWPIKPKNILSDPFQQDFAHSCSKPLVPLLSYFIATPSLGQV